LRKLSCSWVTRVTSTCRFING